MWSSADIAWLIVTSGVVVLAVIISIALLRYNNPPRR